MQSNALFLQIKAVGLKHYQQMSDDCSRCSCTPDAALTAQLKVHDIADADFEKRSFRTIITMAEPRANLRMRLYDIGCHMCCTTRL
jgi:hypothetical protein